MTKLMNFNCPGRTREKLEFISEFTGMSFTDVIINAIDAAYKHYRFEKSERDALDAVNVGDRVHAWKNVMGIDYYTTGQVVSKRLDKFGPAMCIKDEESGERDWFRIENGIMNGFKLI